MKTVEQIISDIQENYGIPDCTVKNGPCELCGYDTLIAKSATLYGIPYKDKMLTVCSYCRSKAEKKWVGEAHAKGGTIDKVQATMIGNKNLLNYMDDEKLASLLTERLQKRLSGYGSQKQMVPE